METFPYQWYGSNPTFGDPSEFYFRPMLLVTIFGISGRFDTIGLVDTGAVETVIPMDYWDEVEPVFRPGEEGELDSANGTPIFTKYGTVDIATQLGDIIYRWSVKVGFSNERDELVLGDLGFLRHFAVDFSCETRRMTVHDPVSLPAAFVAFVPTDELPRSYADVRNQMSRHGKQRERRRPRPRRRPPSPGARR